MARQSRERVEVQNSCDGLHYLFLLLMLFTLLIYLFLNDSNDQTNVDSSGLVSGQYNTEVQ